MTVTPDEARRLLDNATPGQGPYRRPENHRAGCVCWDCCLANHQDRHGDIGSLEEAARDLAETVIAQADEIEASRHKIGMLVAQVEELAESRIERNRMIETDRPRWGADPGVGYRCTKELDDPPPGGEAHFLERCVFDHFDSAVRWAARQVGEVYVTGTDDDRVDALRVLDGLAAYSPNDRLKTWGFTIGGVSWIVEPMVAHDDEPDDG